MRNIFKESRIKRFVESLDTNSLDNELEERTRELESLRSDIKNIKSETNSLGTIQEDKVTKLQNELDMYLNSLHGEEENLAKEIEKLNVREQKYTKAFIKSQSEIDDKVNLLVNQRKALIEQEKKQNVTKTKQKDEIESKLAELRQQIAQQEQRYNENIDKVKTDLAALKEKNATVVKDINHKFEMAKEQGKQALDKLEKDKSQAISEHHEAMERLNTEYADNQEIQSVDFKNSLNEKRDNLFKLLSRIDDLNEDKANLIKQFNDRKGQLDREYDDICKENQATRDAALNAKFALENELKEKETLLEKTVAAQQNDLDNRNQELDSLINSLKTIRIDSLQQSEDELTFVQRDLKNKYTEYVGHLDEKYVEEKHAIEEEIASLEYKYKVEKEELVRQNSSLKAQLNEIKLISKKEIAEDEAHIEASKNELESLKQSFEASTRQLEEEIAAIQRTNDSEAKVKTAELQDELNKRKRDYQEKIKNINKEIEDANYRISLVDNDIKVVEEDAKAVEDSAAKRLESAERSHEVYMRNLGAETQSIEDAIREIEQKIDRERTLHQEEMNNLFEKEARLTKAHEEEIARIEAAHNKELEKLNLQYQEDYDKATNDSNERVNALKAQTDQEINDLTIEHDKYRAESESKKNQINVEIDNLKENVGNKISALQAQHSEILQKIDEIKVQHQNMMDALTSEKQAVENEHQETLERIRTNHENAIMLADEENEKIIYEQNQKLNSTNELLTAKKIELENSKDRLENERLRLETELKEQLAENEVKIAQANAELEAVQIKLEKTSELNRKTIEDFSDELVKRKQTNQEYVKSMDNEIEAIKLEKENAKKMTSDEFEARLNAFIQECHEKEDEFRKQCEFEIQAKRDELKIKQDALDKTIYAIKQSKTEASDSLEARYQRELSKANELEANFQELSRRLELERIDLTKEIEVTRAHNDEEIKLLRQDNQALIDLKIDEYHAIIDAQKKKQDAVEEEIRRVSNEITVKADEFKKLKINEERRIAEAKQTSEDYLRQIAEKIAGLVSQEHNLNQAHEEKLENLFRDINDVKEEYEAVLKAKPISLRGIEEESDHDIEERTAEFRMRLASAEASFNEVIKEIERNRNDLLAKVSKEIEDLISGEKDVIDSYEHDVVALSTTYERMINDEQHRQEIFANKLANAKTAGDEFRKQSEKVLADLNESLKVNAEELGKSLKDQLSAITSENDEIITRELEKQKRFDDKLDEVNRNYAALTERYAMSDEQLAHQKALLINSYQRKIELVKTAYTKALEAQRARFQSVDFMSDEIFDIFKKNQA